MSLDVSTENEALYATDRSLPNSISLAFSDYDSSEDENESHHKLYGQNKRKDTIATPEEKLRVCEKSYDSHHNKGETERAFNQLIRLVPLRRLVFGDHHWKYAEAFMKLAKGYLEYKGYATQAAVKAERAKNLITSCNSPTNDQKLPFTKCLTEIYLVLGKSLCQIRKYKEAENSLTKSLQVLKNLDKQMSSIQIPTASFMEALVDTRFEIKCALHDVYIATKDIDKAVSSLTSLLDEISKISDKDERLILVYSKLAKAEKARKKSQIDHEIIIDYAIKAHNISTSTHALHSLQVADTAFALGRAYSSIDSEETLSAGETHLKEALSAYMSNCGSNHEKTLQVQDALTKIWMRNGKEDDVIKSIKASLPAKRETFGECSLQVAESQKLIAGIYLTKGDLAKAHQYLKQALTVETELYGSHHFKTKATKTMLSQVEDNPGFKKSSAAKLTERPKFTSTIKSSR